MGCGPCTGVEDCWCTILEYYEDLLADPTANLMPGGVGLYSRGSTAADATNRFDNMVVSSWGESCIQVCSPWYDWTSSWSEEGSPALWDTGLPHPESEQMLAFKYLYEGSLLDFSYGRNAPVFQIDVDVRKKLTSDDLRNVSSPASTFCDGMNLKVDLPPPDSAITNIDDVRAFLQPTASSVDFVPGSSELFAEGNFVPNFDNDPLSATFDPIPIVARGSTPIANSLWDAYDWYVNHQETEPWATDPLARCRLWYVVLITDGEESCGLDLCGPGSVAEAFSTLEDAVPVYTVGYAGGFQVDVGTGTESPVACISYETGGQFYTADNANDLSDALFSVINAIDARDRSFVPFKVAPPPSPSGTGPEDFLAVFPFFTPLQDRPLWEGDLYGFKLNADNPRLGLRDRLHPDRVERGRLAHGPARRLAPAQHLHRVELGQRLGALRHHRDLHQRDTALGIQDPRQRRPAGHHHRSAGGRDRQLRAQYLRKPGRPHAQPAAAGSATPGRHARARRHLPLAAEDRESTHHHHVLLRLRLSRCGRTRRPRLPAVHAGAEQAATGRGRRRQRRNTARPRRRRLGP
jgi:hypothetical protein